MNETKEDQRISKIRKGYEKMSRDIKARGGTLRALVRGEKPKPMSRENRRWHEGRQNHARERVVERYYDNKSIPKRGDIGSVIREDTRRSKEKHQDYLDHYQNPHK